VRSRSDAVGSCEDKLQLLFMMYDRDHSGSLSRAEVSEMIRFVDNFKHLENNGIPYRIVQVAVEIKLSTACFCHKSKHVAWTLETVTQKERYGAIRQFENHYFLRTVTFPFKQKYRNELCMGKW